ncbi:hypothetical protein ACEPAF_2779 [Sanghuangporus sanghuang]
MHRRKSSKETVEQENLVVNDNWQDAKLDKPVAVPFPNGSEGKENASGLPELQLQGSPLKTRMNTGDREEHITQRQPPASAGPYRTSFGSLAQTPPNVYAHPASPLRKSFTHGHGRTLSSSGASLSFASPMLSPPPRHAGHFPSRSISMVTPSSPGPGMNGSPPEGVVSAQLPDTPSTPPSTRRHHHQRIHSRNLSVFFPRPGSLPTSSIAEDSDVVQEATITLNDSPQIRSVRLQDPPGPRRLGEGFTFGGRPERTPSTSSSDGGSAPSAPSSSKPKRRGHHHKHSLSHNFFSFLEPGAHLQPSTSPEQAWTPVSPRMTPASATSSTFTQAQSESGTAVGLTSPNPDPLTRPQNVVRHTVTVSAVQFVLGAALWVSGQQNGSLACTGLGYWVVFDSFGVALRHVLPAYLSSESIQSKTRWPYGKGRIETLLLFAQTIYLIFSSVYVSKEAVEHLLLAAGDGHHYHHPRDEDMDAEGIRLPIFLILATIVSLLSTCLFYDNHRSLITTSGHKLPSFARIFSRSRNYGYSSFNSATPTDVILSNPFTFAPLLFSVASLSGTILLPAPQHESYDLLLALFEAVLTFKIAYPAAEVQGAVLLQTAPPRGLPGGRMESFLRVMREIERHPLVLHLPAPHIWQLTPSTTTPSSSSLSHSIKSSSLHLFTDASAPLDALVVTLELHVRRDTDDGEILALTRWAHERCRLALGLGLSSTGNGFGEKEKEADPTEDGAEITIGIVKG